MNGNQLQIKNNKRKNKINSTNFLNWDNQYTSK